MLYVKTFVQFKKQINIWNQKKPLTVANSFDGINTIDALQLQKSKVEMNSSLNSIFAHKIIFQRMKVIWDEKENNTTFIQFQTFPESSKWMMYTWTYLMVSIDMHVRHSDFPGWLKKSDDSVNMFFRHLTMRNLLAYTPYIVYRRSKHCYHKIR